MKNIHFVSYIDGSCVPNPGYAGFGIFGYTYRNVNKSKNYKHPVLNLYFTPNGILKENLGNDKIEVISIIEHIEALGGNRSTNNEAELYSLLKCLEIAYKLDNLKTITIFTDSNYVYTSFNDSINKWKQNKWKKNNGLPISHLDLWQKADNYINIFKDNGIEIHVKWIKGHNGDYGNEMSDLFSLIASNASRIERNENNLIILNNIVKFSDYKLSFEEKDFLYFFKNLYFSSDSTNDTNYCFIATSKEDNDLGKRVNTSIFALIEGYIPPIVNNIKCFYRKIKRPHTVTCCIKLATLNDKEIVRLIKLVNIKYLLVKSVDSNSFSFLKDNAYFLSENSLKNPFITFASRYFCKLQNVSRNSDDTEYRKYDITSYLVKNRKICINNQVENVDVTDKVEKDFNITQKILLKVGYDMPSYLALKSIEKEINKIELILEYDYNTSSFSVYTRIITPSRSIICTNISNKYLAK